MSVTEKALAATLKVICMTRYIRGVGSALGPPRKYSIVKANYFYDKAEKDVEELLAKID